MEQEARHAAHNTSRTVVVRVVERGSERHPVIHSSGGGVEAENDRYQNQHACNPRPCRATVVVVVVVVVDGIVCCLAIYGAFV